MNITYDQIKTILQSYIDNDKLLSAYRFELSATKEISLYSTDDNNVTRTLSVSIDEDSNKLFVNVFDSSWCGHLEIKLTELEKYDFLSFFVEVEEYYNKLIERKIKSFALSGVKDINDLDDDD